MFYSIDSSQTVLIIQSRPSGSFVLKMIHLVRKKSETGKNPPRVRKIASVTLSSLEIIWACLLLDRLGRFRVLWVSF